MKVVIAAGGTAGHLNPGLALAGELSRRGHEIDFIGRTEGFELQAVRAQGYRFEGLRVTGRVRGSLWINLKAVSLAGIATMRAMRMLRRLRPDAVVGMGAYVSLPVTVAARVLGIPVVIHEQNAVLGLANRVAARFAAAIALSFESAGQTLRARTVVTGNPVRFESAGGREDGMAAFGLDPSKSTLLVFGGSQGARSINEAVVAAYDAWRNQKLQVLHLTGPERLAEVVESLSDVRRPGDQLQWHPLPSTTEMQLAYGCSDLAVCRAGASTLAELAACALPAVLVPLPGALDQDQAHNARTAVSAGAAVLIADDQLKEKVAGVVLELLNDLDRLSRMQQAMGDLHSPGAAEKLADLVQQVAQ